MRDLPVQQKITYYICPDTAVIDYKYLSSIEKSKFEMKYQVIVNILVRTQVLLNITKSI